MMMMMMFFSCGATGDRRGVFIGRTRRRRRRTVVRARRLRFPPSRHVRLRALPDERSARAGRAVRLQLGAAADRRRRGRLDRAGAAAAEGPGRVAAV